MGAYKSGQGVEQDHAEALKWCRKAVELSYKKPQTILVPSPPVESLELKKPTSPRS